jgi:hypothetical protein
MPSREHRNWQPLPIYAQPKVSIAVAPYRQTDELAWAQT